MILLTFISGVFFGITLTLILFYLQLRKSKKIRFRKRMFEVNQIYYSQVTKTVIEQNVN